MDQPEESVWALGEIEKLDKSIQACAWDGDWFIWAIGEDGTVYGTKEYEEGQVYLNTQVWSVISGAATPEQARCSMQTVKERLATPYGLMLSAPPFVKMPIDVMRAVVFNSGIKENAGIFNHTQGWGVMAECLLGNGDRAYEYYRAAMPAAYNTRAELRQSEPYVQGQTTYSTFSPRPGNTRTSWLTGAAAWSYFSATQYILGLRPELNGLRLDPCIPSTWSGFTATRRFRSKSYQIVVHNPDGVCSGIARMTVDGKSIPGNLIPLDLPGTNIISKRGWENSMDENWLQIHSYEGQGFQPQVTFNSWQVAILNYLDKIHPEHNNSMERHKKTDEVFVLMKGRGILIIGGNGKTVEGVYPQVMEIGKVYNVRVNTWHTILLSKDASVLLMEESNTVEENSEYTTLPEEFHSQIMEIARGRYGG